MEVRDGDEPLQPTLAFENVVGVNLDPETGSNLSMQDVPKEEEMFEVVLPPPQEEP